MRHGRWRSSPLTFGKRARRAPATPDTRSDRPPRGKAEIVELGVIPTLLACLGHQGARQRFLAMFALQCLAAVAENPRGRFLLNDNRDAVDLIEKAAADDPCLDRYAKRAIASMKWTP